MSDDLKNKGIEVLKQMLDNRIHAPARLTDEQSDAEEPPRKKAHLTRGLALAVRPHTTSSMTCSQRQRHHVTRPINCKRI